MQYTKSCFLTLLLLGFVSSVQAANLIEVVQDANSVVIARCYTPSVVYLNVVLATGEVRTVEQILNDNCQKAIAQYKNAPVVIVPDLRPVIESSVDGVTWKQGA